MNALILISKAFSDENRLNIVALILREKRLCVCEICDTLELSQPLVSRHLKQLKEADILQSSKEGKWVIYTLSTEPSELLLAYINHIKTYPITLKKLISCSALEKN